MLVFRFSLYLIWSSYYTSKILIHVIYREMPSDAATWIVMLLISLSDHKVSAAFRYVLLSLRYKFCKLLVIYVIYFRSIIGQWSLWVYFIDTRGYDTIAQMSTIWVN